MLSKIFTMHNFHRAHTVAMVGMTCAFVVGSAGVAAAALPAVSGAAAAPLQLSIVDIFSAGAEATWSMFEGFGEVPELWEGLKNSAEAGELLANNHEWGLMGHGSGGHEMVAGAAEHGGDLLSGIFSDHGAGHGGHDFSAEPRINDGLLPVVPDAALDAM